MGLLSRKKAAPPPPSISLPINLIPSMNGAPTLPLQYTKPTPVQQGADYEGGARQAEQQAAAYHQPGAGALPSPPGSPVQTRAYGQQQMNHPPPASSSSYRPAQPSPSYPAAAYAGDDYATIAQRSSSEYKAASPRIPQHDTREHPHNPQSYSSGTSGASSILYNDAAGDRSSTGTDLSRELASGRPDSLASLRETEARRGGGNDRRSYGSVEMEDGRVEQRQPATIAYEQRSAVPTAPYYPQQAAVVPQRVIPRPPTPPILAPAPIALPLPAPVAAAAASPRKSTSRYNLADFTFLRTLGTGSFGRVHLVRSQHNSRSYAVKVLSKDRVVKMKQVEHTNSEREMLERVRHPFLVNLWGTFKDSKNLYMVMDFVAGGELFSLLRKSQRFPDPVAKFFAAEVALGLDYLHSLDIIYRDLKPENILLGADGHVKITDFGFAKHVPDNTWTLCGTPDYLAPEIVQSRGYNKSVDWYALGVLIFEMLAGYPPFFTEDSNPMRLYEKIIAGKVRYPAYFTPEAKDLLKSLVTSDLTKRFGNLANGPRDIFTHIWFSEVDWNRLYRKEIPAPYVPKVEGDWDASNFDQYPEVDLSEYGSTGPDPHGYLFPAF